MAVSLALAATCLVTAAGTIAVAQSVAGTNGQAVVRGMASYRERIALPYQAFALRLTCLGRKDDTRFDDIGNWKVSADGGTLTLRGGREAPGIFAIKDDRTLRKLDLAGREIESKLNYDLTRREPFEPIEPRLLLRGMYRYMADAGMFQECLTGWRLPVAQEADNAKLEAAYSRTRREPGEAVLVTLEGSLANRPRMEGPGETCGPRQSEATLEYTYWKLTRLA